MIKKSRRQLDYADVSPLAREPRPRTLHKTLPILQLRQLLMTALPQRMNVEVQIDIGRCS
jgi:hypothetical protein